MDNCSSTSGNCSDQAKGNFLVSPGFTFLLSLFLLIDVAAIVIKVLTAAALTAKSIPIHKSLRILLFNLLVTEILTGLVLMAKTINSAILSVSTTMPDIVPSLPLCRFLFWSLAILLPARMFALTTYSTIVFVYIKYGKERIRTGYIVVALVIIWLLAIALGVDRWLPESLDVFYFQNVTCTPIRGRRLIIPLRASSQGIWLIFGGIIPFVVSIIMPIAAYCQEKRYGQHRVMQTTAYKKSVVRLPSFLLIGNTFNFLWMIVPALAFTIVGFSKDGLSVDLEAVMLTFFIFITISLLPTPVFMLIYLRTLRNRVREIVTCYNCACCYRCKSRSFNGDALVYRTTTEYNRQC